MAKESLARIKAGGIGLLGGLGSIPAVLQELQGLNISLLAGALANTKIDLAAIRSEDTIIGALNNDAGVLTDILSSLSIVDLRATGTLTLDTAVASDAVNVNGKVYTFQAGAPAKYGEVQIGADDAASAANLAAAINAYETSLGKGGADVEADADAAVVTITAVAEGTGGNAIVLTSADATITASGAGTLAGGSATGGIKSTGATDQIVLFWFNKK
jgi:hypothetical protein